ncbi:MAG: ribonuclease HII [Oscillospiraceae bacterium]|nr:ribonuclease HII [Oscillospiraceae bacterium]
MDWFFQNSIVPEGYSVVCGLDEAGRGPLAGPVYAAAVILPQNLTIPGLDDSKRLSEKKRDELFEVIKAYAIDWAVAHAEPYEIDMMNILNASMLAMKRATSLLRVRPQLLLVDGNIARGFDIPAIPVVKGDGKLPSVAAASILAKVLRDRFCEELDKQYPEYHFAQHKGYPTKEHRELIKKFGPCPAHRMTFLRNIIGEESDQLLLS